MPRKLRLQYPGAIYHAMNRGDQREDIFRDDVDREKFLSTLGECCRKTEWQIHAYGLMRNHFHLVIQTPAPNLVYGMKWLLGEQGIAQDSEAELERLGWKEDGLSLLPKGHPVKVNLARQLRRETMLSLKWIAHRLHMGSWTYVSNLLAALPAPPLRSQDTLPLFQ